MAEHEPLDVKPLRAKRHANPEFLRAFGHQERQHAVDAQHGEQQGSAPKTGGECKREPAPRQRATSPWATSWATTAGSSSAGTATTARNAAAGVRCGTAGISNQSTSVAAMSR